MSAISKVGMLAGGVAVGGIATAGVAMAGDSPTKGDGPIALGTAVAGLALTVGSLFVPGKGNTTMYMVGAAGAGVTVFALKGVLQGPYNAFVAAKLDPPKALPVENDPVPVTPDPVPEPTQ